MILTVLFFIVMGIFVLGGASFMAAEDITSQSDLFASGANFYVAESGVEDAVYRLENGISVSGNTLTIDGKTASIIFSTTSTSTTITAVSSTTNALKRIQAGLSAGSGIAFNYGIQAGNGGMVMNGGSRIVGNVYTNGSIIATNGVTITGTAIAAGASQIGNSTYSGGVYVGDSLHSIGDIWAHTVKGATAYGHMYCATGSNNNKSCDTSRGDAPSVSLPYTTQDMIDWETAAAAGGTISGNYAIGYQGGTLGPKKITGNLTVDGGGTLTLSGPIWVVGSVTVTGGGKVVLPANYGKSSETIIANGIITLNGGSSAGSGSSGSYLFFVSTSSATGNSDCSGTYAITITGGAGTIAVNAQNGGVSLSGGAAINAATGNHVCVTGGSTVTYDNGLASPYFVSGPKGGYSLSSWGEL
jgi:hypothetical protein